MLGLLEIAQALFSANYGRSCLEHNSPLLLYRWVFPWECCSEFALDMGETLAWLGGLGSFLVSITYRGGFSDLPLAALGYGTLRALAPAAAFAALSSLRLSGGVFLLRAGAGVFGLGSTPALLLLVA